MMKLAPFESSMPGSILKALVGNGKRAEPRAFYFIFMIMVIMMIMMIMVIVMIMMIMMITMIMIMSVIIVSQKIPAKMPTWWK